MKSKSQIDEMISYYDHRAKWHDEYMSYEGLEKMEKLFKPILYIIEPLIKNKSVLEIASGTGNWTQVLAHRAKHVTTVDSSRQSIALAVKKCGDIENISFLLSDAYLLTNVNDTFDTVFSSDWFSHIPKSHISSFLSTLQAKVKHGAPIIFLDMMDNEYFQNEKSYLDTEGNRVSKRELPNGEVFEVIKNFPSKAELFEIFSEFGTDIRYTEFDSLQRWMLDFISK